MFCNVQKALRLFFQKMEPMLFSVQIPITCIGVNCMKASTEGCFMAVGCENGMSVIFICEPFLHIL